MPSVIGEEGNDYLIGTDDGRQIFIPKNAVGDLFPNIPYASDFAAQNTNLVPPEFDKNELLEPSAGIPVQPQIPEVQGVSEQPVSQRQATGVSVSQRGFSPTQFEQVKKAIPLTSDTGKSLGKLTKAQQREQELAEPFESVQAEREQAVQQLGEAQSTAVQQQADVKSQLAGVIGEQAKQEIEIVDRANSKADQVMTRYDELSKEVEALEKRGVDRGRLYKNYSTGQKLGFAVAAFIDGFLKPKTGGTGGVKILLDLIDKDVEDQVRDIELARGRLDRVKNHAAFILSSAGQSQALRSQARGILIDSAIRDAEAKLARIPATSGVKKAEAANMIAELRKEQALNRQNIRTRVFDETRQEEALKIQRGQLALGYANLKFQKEESEKRRQSALAQAEATRTIRNSTTGATIGAIRPTFQDDPKVVRDVQDRVVSYESSRELASRYRAALNQAKSGRSPFQIGRLREQDYANMDAMFNDLLSQLIYARSGAAANVEEVKRLKDIIPGPKKILQRNNPADILDEFLSTQDANIRKNLNAFVDISDKNSLPDLLFKSLDTSGGSGQPPTPEQTFDDVIALRNTVKENPGNVEAAQLLRQQANGLTILAAENPENIHYIISIADKIPKNLRTDEQGNDIRDQLKRIQRQQEQASIDVTSGVAHEARRRKAISEGKILGPRI